MIKAIFFDWFNTLAHYEPPREEVYRNAFKEHNVSISFEQAYRGLLEGDRQYFALRSRGLIKDKSLSDSEDVLVLYPQAISRAAGITISSDLQRIIIHQAIRGFSSRTVLFEDVLPVFEKLKKKQFRLGIITNADQSILTLIERLGLNPYLEAIITSELARAEKPDVAIFKAAYMKTGLNPDEMAYVGDQYNSDVLGAKAAGSLGILLDRNNLEERIKDCPRITGLNQLFDQL